MHKLNSQKYEVVSGKSSFFLIDPFCTHIQFVLTLAFDMALLYENVALLFVVIRTKKWYSSFLRKVLVFQKTCFKVKFLKTFKIS